MVKFLNGRIGILLNARFSNLGNAEVNMGYRYFAFSYMLIRCWQMRVLDHLMNIIVGVRMRFRIVAGCLQWTVSLRTNSFENMVAILAP